MSNDLIVKISKIVSILFMALGAIFLALIWANGSETQNNLIDPYFTITYIIFGLCAFFAIAFPIAFMIMNPKQALRALFVLVAFVVIFGIAYFLASDSVDSEVMQKAVEEGGISEIGSKRVGMGLIGTYIIAGIAIIVTIFAGISKVFKH
ncbi:MAG: hypothetical protein K9J13_06450 [Saprospiraceae bacterium]|nr:hypothetical protein [Saprospiraceae bacterium]